MFKKIIGLTIVSFLIIGGIAIAKPVLVQASEGPALPGQSQEVAAEETGKGNNQNLFSMAVLLFGIGEFAGLIGKGVSNIHSNKREERQEARQQAKKQQQTLKEKVLEREMPALLTYAEHKKGLYKEISSIVKLPHSHSTENAALKN